MTQISAFVMPTALLQINGKQIGIRVTYTTELERDTLLQKMGRQIEAKTHLAPDRADLFLLEIRLPCGHSALFKTVADVPREDLACPCGCGGYFLQFVDVSQQYQMAVDSVSIAGTLPAECGYPHSQG